MSVYKYDDLNNFFQAIDAGTVSSAYLVFGDRFLCQETVNELIMRLLPDEGQRHNFLKSVDGEKEDVASTVRMLKTYSLFGGRQVIRVMDTRLFQSKAVASTFWEKAESAYATKDLPQANKYLCRLLALAEMLPADWQTELAACSPDRWQSLFGFPQPDNRQWVEEVFAATTAEIKIPGQSPDAADLLANVLTQGIPANNTLILVAEAVDKRKRLYKFFEKNCVVLDLSVDSGSTSAARKGQEALLKKLVYRTLARYGKNIDSQCLPILFERVGFHPVAIVMETEKLALSIGEAPVIDRSALDSMLSRTREEALYELHEAIGEQNLTQALHILKRLRENGMHALAILAGLRNFLRKLLLARAFQEHDAPKYLNGLAYPAFQKGYLPELQKKIGTMPETLSGHPFVVYKLFRQAEKFPQPKLKQALESLLLAEYGLKGGSLVNEHLILEDFLFSLLGQRPRDPVARRKN